MNNETGKKPITGDVETRRLGLVDGSDNHTPYNDNHTPYNDNHTPYNGPSRRLLGAVAW